MRRFRYRLPVVVALLLLTMAVPTAASAQADTTVTNIRFPLSASAFVPCALGGQEEEVLVSGTAHMVVVVVVTTIDAQGQPHVVVTANYDGLHGMGLTSGDRYVGVAAENQISFEPLAPWVVTMTQTVQFVGQGPDNWWDRPVMLGRLTPQHFGGCTRRDSRPACHLSQPAHRGARCLR